MGVTLEWVGSEAGFSTDEYRQRGVKGVEKALRFYQDARARARK